MEKQFLQGLRVYRPREGAPEFIKLNMVFDKVAFLMWLEAQDADEKGQIRADLKESREGKLYVEKNTWKATSTPNQTPSVRPQNDAQDDYDGLDDPRHQ